MAGRLTPAQIAAMARARGLDPSAVLSVAQQEGLGGGIGDGGHAFGPFQLNDAGGVITGKFPGQSQQQTQDWAWSPQGVDYALGGIQKAAGGLKGPEAVRAIVGNTQLGGHYTGFERPANEGGEIARALAGYGGAGTQTSVSMPQVPANPQVQAPMTAAPSGPRPLPAAVRAALQILRA